MGANSRCGMLPEDVVFQILVWLPVASLLQFKLVCKAWLSHINSSGFIAEHTRRVSNSEENKLIVMNADFRRDIYFSINFISVNNLQLFKYIEFSQANQLHVTGRMCITRLIASLDGIICLEHLLEFGDEDRFSENRDEDLLYDCVISLWNPATTQFTALPPGQTDIKETFYAPNVQIEYGIGFDAKNNDYKVVRVALEYDEYDMESFRSQVEVYSLSMGSWRIIDVVLPLNFLVTCNPKQPFQNEIYCWSGFDQSSRSCLILSFDFSKEVFGIMPVPDACSPSESRFILAFLSGKIACINPIYDNPERRNGHCNIWVLDKYGVKESWINTYTIMLDQAVTPMGFSMDGKIILIKGDRERKLCLCLCDPLTQEVNEITTHGLISETAVYKESLISVKSATGVLRSG